MSAFGAFLDAMRAQAALEVEEAEEALAALFVELAAVALAAFDARASALLDDMASLARRMEAAADRVDRAAAAKAAEQAEVSWSSTPVPYCSAHGYYFGQRCPGCFGWAST